MKNALLLTLLLSLLPTAMFAATSWDNPDVLCPEDVLPKGLECPDFSGVEDPYSDFPGEMSHEEILDWKTNKVADLRVCRNKEVLRREEIKKGSYSAATLELAWMTVDSGNQVAEKLTAIQNASIKYEIPPQVLIGAMKQESLLAALGISPDGGNYSCGMSQLNIQEWCQGMNALSNEVKATYGWPSNINCNSDVLPTSIVKPFYDIAIKKLGSRHDYQLTAKEFKGITLEQVKADFPVGASDLQTKRFKAVSSFVKNCQNISLSVNFKAQTLRNLFNNLVPEKLKKDELYSEGKTFSKACQKPYSSKYYPLHTGWLMAVAMYNAGPLQPKLVGYYYQVKNNNFPSMNPLNLIEALHWGGKYSEKSDNIVFKDQDGHRLSQSWFKSCIVQRHVAGVIKYVTAPGKEIAKSLEQAPCSPNEVPEYRKLSSGVKKLNKQSFRPHRG